MIPLLPPESDANTLDISCFGSLNVDMHLPVIFVSGFGIWNIDNAICPTLTSWKRTLGMPWSFVLELHGWWHIFTGAGAYICESSPSPYLFLSLAPSASFLSPIMWQNLRSNPFASHRPSGVPHLRRGRATSRLLLRVARQHDRERATWPQAVAMRTTHGGDAWEWRAAQRGDEGQQRRGLEWRGEREEETVRARVSVTRGDVVSFVPWPQCARLSPSVEFCPLVAEELAGDDTNSGFCALGFDHSLDCNQQIRLKT